MFLLTKESEKLAQELWLDYFNDSLYTKGHITETQWNKMRLLISKALK